MRTTLTLEDDVGARLKRLARKRGSSFKSVVNEALKHGMARMTAPPETTPYRTKPCHLGAFIGVDPAKLGQIDDELDDVRRMRGDDSG